MLAIYSKDIMKSFISSFATKIIGPGPGAETYESELDSYLTQSVKPTSF